MMIKKLSSKLFALFLAAMLAMTFVSRVVYTKKLAVVTVKNLQHIRLTKNIKCSGTLEPTAVTPVFLPEGLTVEKITAAAGSSVVAGDELLRLDKAQLKDKAERLKREINESVADNGLYSKEETPIFTEEDIPIKSVSVKAGDKVSEGDELFMLDCERLLILINDLETERNEDIINRDGILAHASDDTEEGESGLPNTEADVLALSIAQKQAKIDRYLALYKSGGKVCAPCSGTVTKVEIKTGDLTQRSAALLIGGDIQPGAAVADKEQQLSDLLELIKQDGAVVSPADGQVTEQPLRAGSQTGDGAAVCIADETSPMIFSADITEEDARNIAVGDSAQLTFRGGRIVVNECCIASVTKSANGIGFRLTVPLENSKVSSGETGQLTVSTAADEASDCVPNIAVKGSKTNRCIYVLRTEEGFLGKEYHAERLSVTTGLSNEGLTALDDTGLTEEDLIICTDKELTDGQTVRIRE